MLKGTNFQVQISTREWIKTTIRSNLRGLHAVSHFVKSVPGHRRSKLSSKLSSYANMASRGRFDWNFALVLNHTGASFFTENKNLQKHWMKSKPFLQNLECSFNNSCRDQITTLCKKALQLFFWRRNFFCYSKLKQKWIGSKLHFKLCNRIRLH